MMASPTITTEQVPTNTENKHTVEVSQTQRDSLRYSRHSANTAITDTTLGSHSLTSTITHEPTTNLPLKYASAEERKPSLSQAANMSGPPKNEASCAAIQQEASPPGDHSGTRPPISTLLCFSALTLSIFLAALDTVLIPTALPSISRDFDIPDSLYAWTGSAYLLANAASIPLWGKLSDIFGRKPIIMLANSIFLVGSILCAVSTSAAMLVGGRSVQGLGGGGINVLVYVCVADLFAIRHVSQMFLPTSANLNSDRSFYMGIVGAMYAVASALGPVLGGVFAERLNWRWCFYINLPLVSIAIITLYFTVRLHDPRTPFLKGMKSLDWLGTFTILIATVLLLVGLQLGGTTSYSRSPVICLLVLGSLSYIMFPWTQWWYEKRGGSPITPLRIFRDLSNLSALGVCACDALVFNSVAYFLPLYFQLVLSSSPQTSGVYMLAVAIPLAICSFVGGWVIEKTGRYLEVLQLGLALMTVGVGLFISFEKSLQLVKIIFFLVIIGIGFGPNFNAPLIALQTRIQESDMAAGTSAFGFVRMISGAIGVVVGQVVFQILMRPHFADFVDAGLTRKFAEALAGGEAISQGEQVALLSDGQRDVVRGEMMSPLRGVWIFYTVVSAVGLIVSFGIYRGRLERGGQGKKTEISEVPRDQQLSV